MGRKRLDWRQKRGLFKAILHHLFNHKGGQKVKTRGGTHSEFQAEETGAGWASFFVVLPSLPV